MREERKLLAAIPPDGATTTELAAAVGMSSESARRWLLDLQARGLVHGEREMAPRGRPPMIWRLVEHRPEGDRTLGWRAVHASPFVGYR